MYKWNWIQKKLRRKYHHRIEKKDIKINAFESQVKTITTNSQRKYTKL